MPFFEAVRLALDSIRTQKLKSFFSAFGVLIGVTFLIAVVSVIQGMNVYMRDTVAGAIVGVNTFQLRQRPNSEFEDISGSDWRRWQRAPRISLAEAEHLRRQMQTPVRMSRIRSTGTTMAWEGRTASGVQVTMADAEYLRIKNWDIAQGRSFTTPEVDYGAAVAVIGNDVATRLFDGRDPLQRMVTIGGLPHRVIGVVESQGTIFGMSMDNFVITPLTGPASRLGYRPTTLAELSIQVLDPADMKAAQEEVEVLMRVRRGLRPAEANNFHIQTAEGALSFWDRIATILFLALPMLVSISLVVGGIVIMNIMLMAVAERTREIGIRKALGARRRDIMRQFIVESAALSVGGAILGIGSGLLLAFTIRAFSPLPAAVAPWSIGLGVGLGILVGMGAGLYPARQASRLDPIAAMRNE